MSDKKTVFRVTLVMRGHDLVDDPRRSCEHFGWKACAAVRCRRCSGVFCALCPGADTVVRGECRV